MGSYGVVEMRRQTFAIVILWLLAVCMISLLAIGSFPDTAAGYEWSRTYGGHFQDNCFSLVDTSDGGYLIGGWTDWEFRNASYSWSIDNFFLLKADKNGNQEWYRIYGDNQSFMGGYVCEAPGGGYVLAGGLGQYDIGSIGLIKVDADGQTLWEKNYRKGFDGRVKSLAAVPDGYILAGTCNGSVFLMRFDPEGNLIWDCSYDVPGLDAGRVLPTTDGGFIVAGGPAFMANSRMFLMKTDAGGNESWIKYYGSEFAGGTSVIEDRAGGYVIVGHESTTNTWPSEEYQGSDVYVVRTDRDGNVLWDNTYVTSPDDDYANDIVQADDSGYTVTGTAVRSRSGRYVIDSDAFLLRLDSNGTQQWLKKFGSPGKAYGIALLKCDDGAIVLAGERHNSDILLIKSPDAPDALAPLEETIKPVEVLLYHHPEIIYCITPLFLAAFVSLSVALITIKRSLDKRKRPP